MGHSPFFVYSCWNLTSLFNFWKVKVGLMVMLRWQIQTKAVTLSTRRIKQVLFLAAQNSIHWLSVTWWHWVPGPAHIFSPYISDNSVLSLIMDTDVRPELACSRVACLAAREELRAGWAAWWQQEPRTRWSQRPSASHPALVTRQSVNICRAHHFSKPFETKISKLII